VPLTTHDFKIRDAEVSDFETLWHVDQACFPPGISYSRSELRFYMQRRGAFTLVAENAPEATGSRLDPGDSKSARRTEIAIAGFIVAEANRRVGHIITIDVVAGARRFGVGSLLLQRAEERLLGVGSVAIELETSVDSGAALRFYKKHGYSVTRTLPHYYSTGVDALELRKELAIESDNVLQK
jgi:[ribosomal protein S18]-alanine N-acetyltransferase